jgi:hypothetical protein
MSVAFLLNIRMSSLDEGKMADSAIDDGSIPRQPSPKHCSPCIIDEGGIHVTYEVNDVFSVAVHHAYS